MIGEEVHLLLLSQVRILINSVQEAVCLLSFSVVKDIYSMKEAVCTVCESKEPVICCATCEALYCASCKISVHEKVTVNSPQVKPLMDS